MMEFQFSKQNLSGWDYALERFFEILPGFTSWLILLGMLVLSFLDPIFAAVLIIAFDFYWLLRLFYMTLFLILAYFRLSVEKETDWMARARQIDGVYQVDFPSPLVGEGRDGGDNAQLNPPPFSSPIRQKSAESVRTNLAGFWRTRGEEIRTGTGLQRLDFKKRISLWAHARQLKKLKKSGALPPRSSDIYHLVIFSVAKESAEIVEPGIESLAVQKFPPKRMLVVIALEEWAQDDVKKSIFELQAKYKDMFFDVVVALHPEGLAGEARVKGANVTHAAKQAALYFERRKIPFEHVVVSCFDADTIVSHEYFTSLTYHFMVFPKRNRASFQPIPVYHNNIWEVSAFARVLDVGASFFQLIEATNPERLVTFSSHSMSFKALVEMGYWPVDMISDDSAIFWKALIHFNGDYRVIPMYVTLSMDVVSGDSWWKSAVNVYRQKRRWAWGVENFPIVMRGFLKANQISLYDKLRYGFKLFEDNVAWATWAFLLSFIGWLPALFAGREFSSSVLYYSTPRITGLIFHLAALALVATLILGQLLLPRKKARFQILRRIGFVLEWFFIPVIVVFWSALPALDAQTRLMFGKYMEFWVSEKKVLSTDSSPLDHADQSS